MTEYKIAHVQEEGNDIIFVPLDCDFAQKPNEEKQEVVRSLQLFARCNGMAGQVVPVWASGPSFSFIAPLELTVYLRGLSWDFITGNINKTLACH